MKDGIYYLAFRSPLGARGAGLAVIAGHSLNGDDDGYLYQGHLHQDNATISSKVYISRCIPEKVLVFGPLENLDLELAGTWQPNGHQFSLKGAIPGQPQLQISVDGRKLCDLAQYKIMKRTNSGPYMESTSKHSIYP